MELKKATTFDEQLELIKEKGFVILKEEEQSCIDFLSRTNYYRVSAYFLPFCKEGRIKSNCIHFKRVQNIYEFDSRLRNLISNIIEDIEVSIRTQVGYYIGHKYGATGYLDESIYTDKHDHEKFLSKVIRCVEENSNTLVVKHYKNKYDNQYPIWVIIEYFSIGMLSYFYKDINTKDKKIIAGNLKMNIKELESWLRCITDLRNKCAHYSRIYFWTFSALPRMPKHLASYKERGLFRQLIMLREMYPCKADWNTKFATPLQALVSNYQDDILLEDMGFPENWEEILFI